MTYIMHDLKEKGFAVEPNVTTVEEAGEQIRKTLEKKINDIFEISKYSRHRTILSGKKYSAQTGSKSETGGDAVIS